MGDDPSHLINQIDQYLGPLSPVRRFVHGDLACDHPFIEAGRLAGNIDWGGAELTDPYLELVYLHFDCLKADKELLAQFLKGYDWRVHSDFPRRALSATLRHEFDGFDNLGSTRPGIDLKSFNRLQELAAVLWDTTADS